MWKNSEKHYFKPVCTATDHDHLSYTFIIEMAKIKQVFTYKNQPE